MFNFTSIRIIYLFFFPTSFFPFSRSERFHFTPVVNPVVVVISVAAVAGTNSAGVGVVLVVVLVLSVLYVP